MAATDYKQLKIDFVSGHNGTSLFEIALVTYIPVAGLLLRTIFVMFIPFLHTYLTEFIIVVVPVILSCTLLSDHLSLLYTILLGSTLVLVLLVGLLKFIQGEICLDYISLEHTVWSFARLSVSRPFPFATNSRCSVTLISVVAILAVDFVVFPRRFAKCESYGSGLMDTGVGLFIIAQGGVSPEARSALGKVEWEWNLLRNLLGTVPLLVLGVIRFATTSGLDYHTPLTEYGYHWNFFFTLWVVRVAVSLLEPVIVYLPMSVAYLLPSLLLIGGYQFALSQLGLSEYLLHGYKHTDRRVSLFDANREGILSSIGFTALYMASVQLGKYMFKSRFLIKSWIPVQLKLGSLAGALWTLTVLSHTFIEPISRRMANLTYYLWMLALSITALVLFFVVDLISLLVSYYLNIPLPTGVYNDPTRKTIYQRETAQSNNLTKICCIVSGIHENHLAFFLIANLLTGLVNLTVDTLSASVLVSMIILLFYMFVLCFIFVLAKQRGIRTKFW